MNRIDQDSGLALRTPRRTIRAAGKRNFILRVVPRPVLDALVAFLLFLGATMSLGCAPTSAHPSFPRDVAAQRQTQALHAIGEDGDRPIIEIATTSSPNSPDAVYRRTSTAAAWLLLSLAFSVIAAFNLAFVRHMRRVYVRPRASKQK